MQLTLINFFKRTVPGHIFRGKKRLVKQVSRRSMDTMIREFELQEKNMLLLRNPYLSVVSSEYSIAEVYWLLYTSLLFF